MKPQENIRWYWEDLSSKEKVYLLEELYSSLDARAKDKFLKLTYNN
jgi:hypothetical protein